jgi:hypothetical protein
MAVKGHPGEHLATAKELLEGLGAATDVQTRATVALGHSILAVAEQLASIRIDLRNEAGMRGSRY